MCTCVFVFVYNCYTQRRKTKRAVRRMLCAEILEQSMGVRNRVGIRLSYRPARLYRQGESIPKLLKSLKIPSLIAERRRGVVGPLNPIRRQQEKLRPLLTLFLLRSISSHIFFSFRYLKRGFFCFF
jgi:hypothetical protein